MMMPDNKVKSSFTHRLLDKLLMTSRGAIGKPVYLVENGEEFGVVTDIVQTESGKILTYTIEAEDYVMQAPAENIIQTPHGLIFQPKWVIEGDRVLKALEFQESVYPDIALSLKEYGYDTKRLEEIIKNMDPEIKRLIEEGRTLKKTLI